MSISQSLAKILNKMGGGEPDAPAGGEEAILAEIAETYDPESGIELPKVTTDDNGKVLGVVEGVWGTLTLADNSPVVLNATVTEDIISVSSIEFTGVTFNQVWGALQQNKRVVVNVTETGEDYTTVHSLTLLNRYTNALGNGIKFFLPHSIAGNAAFYATNETESDVPFVLYPTQL